MVIVSLFFKLHDGSRSGVDLIAVLITAGFELHFVDRQTVIGVQLAPEGGDVVCRQARVVQGQLSGLGFGDGGAGSRTLGRRRSGALIVLLRFHGGAGDGARRQFLVVVVGLFFKLHDGSRSGVDLTVVFIAPGLKLHIIDHDAVFRVQFRFIPCQSRGGDTGLAQGKLLGLCLTDISLVAGGANGFHLGCCLSRGHQQIQFVDGQGGQFFKGVEGIFLKDLLNELGFARCDAVLLRQLTQTAVILDGLAQHRAAESVGLKKFADFLGKPRLQLRTPDRIIVIHADENGIGQFAEIAVLEHGPNEGVYRHVQIAAGEVHVPHDGFSVLVQGEDLQHPLLPVDLDLHTGIDIQGYRGVHGVIDTVGLKPENTPRDQAEAGGHADQFPCPGIFLLFVLFHDCHVSFLFRTVGEDSVPCLRHRVGTGLPEPLVDLALGHCCRLLYKSCLSFFIARWYFERTVGNGSSSRAAISRCLKPETAWSVTIWRSSPDNCSKHAARTARSSGVTASQDDR